jgi:hypothetical protein
MKLNKYGKIFIRIILCYILKIIEIKIIFLKSICNLDILLQMMPIFGKVFLFVFEIFINILFAK